MAETGLAWCIMYASLCRCFVAQSKKAQKVEARSGLSVNIVTIVKYREEHICKNYSCLTVLPYGSSKCLRDSVTRIASSLRNGPLTGLTFSHPPPSVAMSFFSNCCHFDDKTSLLIGVFCKAAHANWHLPKA